MTAEWTVAQGLAWVCWAIAAGLVGVGVVWALLAMRRRYGQRFRVPAEHQAGLRHLFEELDRIDSEGER